MGIFGDSLLVFFLRGSILSEKPVCFIGRVYGFRSRSEFMLICLRNLSKRFEMFRGFFGIFERFSVDFMKFLEEFSFHLEIPSDYVF